MSVGDGSARVMFHIMILSLPKLNSADGRGVSLSVVHWWNDADSKNQSFWQIVCCFATFSIASAT